jgi:ankyrin repeat protein
MKGNTGNTILFFLTKAHNLKPDLVEMLKILLNSGLEINSINNDGDTALLFAVRNANLNFVRFLLNSV